MLLLLQAGVPALVMFATGSDDFRKPGMGMWQYFIEHLNGGVQPGNP
jgi:hypothetical protein